MKKKLVAIFGALTVLVSVYAQSPLKFSYQAVVRNSDNELVSNQTVGMQISIIKTTSEGEVVYKETQAPSTNSNGLVNIQIGAGTPLEGSMRDIEWEADSFFIKTETDPAGGMNYSIKGTSQLISVPYALCAKTAENINTYSVGDLAHGGIVFWVDESGQHGLVCSKRDQSKDSPWNAGVNTYCSAFGNGLNSGKMNTLLIIANQGYGNGYYYAAKACHHYQTTENGVTYGDWYLPSIYELELMYNVMFTIYLIALENDGEPLSQTYWSSTESGDYAWSLDFSSLPSTSSRKLKSYKGKVRPIRAF